MFSLTMKHLFNLLFLFTASFGLAQCPFGNGTRVECVYGCDNFIDKNGDGYCDYSRILAKETPDTATTTVKTDTIHTPSKQTKTDAKPKFMEANQTMEEEKDTVEMLSNETNILVEETPVAAKTPKPYRLILISALTLGSYFLTFLLSHFGILHKVYHRRIWNTLLLLTAAISCLFGFFLVIQLNYRLFPDCYRSILTWHVECGIAMTIILVFHVIWHVSYFKHLFMRVKKYEKEENKKR